MAQISSIFGLRAPLLYLQNVLETRDVKLAVMRATNICPERNSWKLKAGSVSRICEKMFVLSFFRFQLSCLTLEQTIWFGSGMFN